MFVIIFDSGKCGIALILLGSGMVPSLLTTWPKNVISLQQNNICLGSILGLFP